MDGHPSRPVSVGDVIGPAPSPTSAGRDVQPDIGEADAHKILARTLRREGRFADADQAAARYRELRIAGTR